MSELRVRSLDEGELADADTLLDQLPRADQALAGLARLGGLEPSTLRRGDGWAAVAEVDGTSLLARGEPAGDGACWTISVKPGAENATHAAQKLRALVDGS